MDHAESQVLRKSKSITLTGKDVERIHKLLEKINIVSSALFLQSLLPRFKIHNEIWGRALTYFYNEGMVDAKRLLDLVEELNFWLEVLMENNVKNK